MQRSPSLLGSPLTMRQKRQLLKDRFHLMVGPLILVLGLSLSSSDLASTGLAWIAGALLVALTINRIVR